MSVTDSNFEDSVINNPKPVLVLFSLPTSGHAKLMEGRFAELDAKYETRVVHAGECLAICNKFGVTSVPTTILFKDKAPAVVHKGLLSVEELQKILD